MGSNDSHCNRYKGDTVGSTHFDCNNKGDTIGSTNSDCNSKGDTIGCNHSPWDPSTSRRVGDLLVDTAVVFAVKRVQRGGRAQLTWGDDVSTLQTHRDETHCTQNSGHVKQRRIAHTATPWENHRKRTVKFPP